MNKLSRGGAQFLRIKPLDMYIKKILNELGIIPRKSRGQNFLIDENIAKKIVNFASIQKDDLVLEIGAGVGAISGGLIEKARDYFGVEIEEKFVDFLRTIYPDLPPKHFINKDIRQLDLAEIFTNTKFIIVSNLPYSISSEVVFWILKNRQYIKAVTLLLQREFAQRLAAQPNTKDYGSITVQCNLYTNSKLGDIVSGNCFVPKADVESRLIKLEILDTPRFKIDNEELFERVLRGAFSTRRKTIANALKASLCNSNSALGFRLVPEDLLHILEVLHIDSSCRAETLTVEDFCKISNKLGEFY